MNITWIYRFLLSSLFATLLMAAQSTAPAAATKTSSDSEESCLGCHDQGKKIAKSVHGSLSCSTCHEKHEEYPHPAGVPKPACASCHADVGQDYARGVHGQEKLKGNAAAPECGTCHGSAHEIVS